MTKTEELSLEIQNVLAESPLDRGEKIKAMLMARSTLDHNTNSNLDEWRRNRAAQGVVGSGKKSAAIREDLAKQKSKKK